MNFRKSSHQLVAINWITHKLFQHLRNIIQLLQRREFTSYLINRQLLVYSLNKLTFTLFQFNLSFLEHFFVIIKIRIKGFIIFLHNTSHLLLLRLKIYLQFFISSISIILCYLLLLFNRRYILFNLLYLLVGYQLGLRNSFTKSINICLKLSNSVKNRVDFCSNLLWYLQRFIEIFLKINGFLCCNQHQSSCSFKLIKRTRYFPKTFGCLNKSVHTPYQLITLNCCKQFTLKFNVLIDFIHILSHCVNSRSHNLHTLTEFISKCTCHILEGIFKLYYHFRERRFKLINSLMKLTYCLNHTDINRWHQLVLYPLIKFIFVSVDLISRLASRTVARYQSRNSTPTSNHRY